MFGSDVVPAWYKRRHESVANWFGDAFDDIERVNFLIDGFPSGIFEGDIPKIRRLERRK